jgi:uncharacterized membrane protein (DUF2068 family)
MQPKTSDRYLVFIGIFKLVKGTLLLCVAVGFLGLLHKDVQDVATTWIERLHFDPDNSHIGGLLEKCGLITDKQITLASALSAFYAALFLTEGVGLLLKKKWAKYFTIIVTGSLIPLEVYEVIRHFHLVRTVVLLINIGIVWFLFVMLRQERRG